MRCSVLLVLFLQCLGGLGLPLFELSSKADDALRMALDEINTRFARYHLYRVSKATVTKVVPLGANTYDMVLKFGIRETECRKGSGIDPQGCAYRRGFFAGEAGCHMRTHLTERLTNIVSMKCSPAQSSSSESSEEMWTGWQYDPNRLSRRDPDTSPQLYPGRHGVVHEDYLSNHLE
ncbi:secreted phosphoprotein 24 isoform 2-T2 [Clarias gariepinus]|uniref:secreted phosphoprotein 24 isoform X2 n=1 Tax=Clarias gariepinus TaxID=13013 RepID=UPI00234D78FF|nr:secreted phosphoprotein 24 isoform X2 [Clarias gariepinus]